MLDDNLSCLRPQTLQKVHKLVVQHAMHSGVESADRFRTDTTPHQSLRRCVPRRRPRSWATRCACFHGCSRRPSRRFRFGLPITAAASVIGAQNSASLDGGRARGPRSGSGGRHQRVCRGRSVCHRVAGGHRGCRAARSGPTAERARRVRPADRGPDGAAYFKEADCIRGVEDSLGV